MAARQTRIFIPSAEPQQDWAETLIRTVVAPLTREFVNALDWFWFSRYGSPSHDSESRPD